MQTAPRIRRSRRSNRPANGFTLVEILIVVIILGILAAIVVPQFTSASEDARKNSAQSLLQTIRSQTELYKMQHNDVPPDLASGWTQMTGKTNAKGNSTVGDGPVVYGPYLQQTPKNPFNGNSGVYATVSAAAGAPDGGFVMDADGKIYCIDGDGNAFGQ